MFNFNQFVNESKDHEFNSIDANDIVNWKGAKYKVKKVGHGIIHLPKREGTDTIKVSLGQWKQYSGKLIEKAEKKDEN
jgi:hypothetical protein